MIKGYKLISGKYGGVRVYCRENYVLRVWDSLVMRANNNNYWALMIVQKLKRLSGGFINNDNIYVSKCSAVIEDFEVHLPGCKVLVAKQKNGDFFIYHIEAVAGDDYVDMQSDGKKPALHRVTKQGKGWKVEHIENSLPDRTIVAISDGNASDLGDSVDLAARRLEKSGKPVGRDGFNYFFSPGNERFGGLINYNQAIGRHDSPALREAAYSAAEVMRRVANQGSHIDWFTECAGSGVFVQALKLTQARQLRLKDNTVFMYRPMTYNKDNEKICHQMGIELKKVSNRLNLNELFGATSPSAAFLRLRNKGSLKELWTGTYRAAKDVLAAKKVYTSVLSVGAMSPVSFSAVALVVGVMAVAECLVSQFPDQVNRHF